MKQRFYKAKALFTIMILIAMLMTLGSIAYIKHFEGQKVFPQLSDNYVLGTSNQNEELGVVLTKDKLAQIMKAQSKQYFFAVELAELNCFALLFSPELTFPSEILEGRAFTQEDFSNKRNVVIVSERIKGTCPRKEGKRYWKYAGKNYEVVGVYKAKDQYGNEKPDCYMNYLANNINNSILNSNFIYDTGKTSLDNIGFISQEVTTKYPGMYIEYALAGTGQSDLFQTYGKSNFDAMLLLLIVATLLVLLNAFIACSNWIEGKRKEIAVRKMIGASQWRITRWILSEFFLLIGLAFFAGVSFSKLFLIITPHLPVAESTLLMFGDSIIWMGVVLGFMIALLMGLIVVGVSIRSYNKKEIVRNIR